jgi:hypothetical protein
MAARKSKLTGLFLIMLLLTVDACRSEKESEPEVPKRDINSVMENHVDELMAIPGVTGVAIGQLEDKTPCILVLVIEETEEISRRVPRTLEGHPVRLLVSGEIKPMSDQ